MSVAVTDIKERHTKEEASIPTRVVVVKENGEEKEVTPSQQIILSSSTESIRTIRLTLQEESLITTILNAIEYYNQQQKDDDGDITMKDTTTPLEVRIAGGWVRDKLMGLSTHDVDIAINTLSGVDFAKNVIQSYLKDKFPNEEVHKIGIIAANPQQSKHLETATMLVKGIECDFCNLRAQEIYDEHSRIPLARNFGTPLEDAQRRDFTCNALFLNLQTLCIEDYTGRGIYDLFVTQTLVTPIKPSITFYDDPLRILRAIRFVVRLNFVLDEAIRIAAMSTTIQDVLLQKVSRERIGKEIEGCLSGKDAKPILAFHLITKLNLSSCVFGGIPNEIGNQIVAEGTTISDTITNAWKYTSSAMDIINHVIINYKTTTTTTIQTQLDERLLTLAAYLLPLRNVTYVDKKKKERFVLSRLYYT